jgi:dihydrolipoamide dehydrogenase
MQEIFDVVVIGGGPGGYVAAIRAAQLGMKTACIEMRGALGGTCLNVGCIPSKALLDSTEKYETAKLHFKEHGINISSMALDLSQMMKRKEEIIDGLNKGIEGLFKKNKVTYIKGKGTIEAEGKVKVTSGEEDQIINAKNIIIATGSSVMGLPGIEIDEERVISSDGALSLKSIPQTMVVVGGGVIGLELGSVWRRLGTDVTVVEYLDRITPGQDLEMGSQLQKILEKQGMKFKLSTKVKTIKKTKNNVEIEVEPASGGKSEKISADVVLVSIGRKPYTEQLGLENIGVKTDNRGRIEIDDNFATSVKGIYAIGDVVRGQMLAHKAEDEGVAVAEIIAGNAGHINYGTIPGVIYTHPEVASVGKTEEEIKEMGIEYNKGKFSFIANSRARAVGDMDGFVKILARKDNDEILGVHIIGPQAGTIIAEVVVAMEYKASSEDIALICHAHPTLNEAVKEAALDVLGRAIHK